MTWPDLSHFFAILPAPCWFWIMTLWPTDNGDWTLVCSDHLSSPLVTLVLMASSLFSLLSTQTSAGEKEPGEMGRKSLIGLPKIICDGANWNSVSGVLRCCISALVTLSQSGDPSDLVLSIRSLLADLTAASWRRLDLG